MSEPVLPTKPRLMGAFNGLGFRTLTLKEITRFTKVYHQTILAPVITSLLFYIVFTVAMGGGDKPLHFTASNIDIAQRIFLVPGLVMMMLAQNAFMNPSGSLVLSKIQGNIVDVLMPPLSPLEIALAYVIGGVVRGLLVAALTLLLLSPFVALPYDNFGTILFFGFMGSFLMATLGLICGIWAQKFEQLSAVQNFVIAPATFLSGAFFTAHQLGIGWQWLVKLNPLFYMIDGFRAGFIGVSDGNMFVGGLLMTALSVISFWIAHSLLASGWKLRN